MVPLWRYGGRLGNQMFQFAYLWSQAGKGIIPDIYLQDEKYFKDVGHQLRQMFQAGQRPDQRVAIHVRRGDYVNHPFYVDLTKTDYYQRAMTHFPGKRFLVVSDDIPFCKEYFKGDQFDFSEGKNEYEDMDAIAACSGQIIANSSFSWWGAYLSPWGGTVIAPLAWYSDGIERTKCPETWKRI